MHDVQEVPTLSDRLVSYLRAELGNPELDFASPLTQLQGGYETSTYCFRLDRASDKWSAPLVLRLYPEYYGTRNAVWESTVQNILAGADYPVARAHLVCTDMSVLGGAFFIMDHLPGQLLVTAPPETVPGLLGTTHAKLHSIDPAPLIQALHDAGIAEPGFRLTGRFDWLRHRSGQLPWIAPAVNWLLAHRPPEPDRLAVCHGDFHPLNILYADGRITGVLDWPGFAIADPAFDVANSLVLITIPSKHLFASMDGSSSVDWDLVAELYLAAYRAHRSLDNTNLDYYRVRRCLLALVEGSSGQKVWQRPLIVRDLLADIRDITGIEIEMPA